MDIFHGIFYLVCSLVMQRLPEVVNYNSVCKCRSYRETDIQNSN